MIRLEEPDHPLLRSFTAASFAHSDEIFVFRDFSRQKVRVLLSLDTASTDMNKPGVTKDQDVPLAWIRRYGEGRVFYSALGHQKDVYWRSPILKHYLSGIQFALGDLKADATPSSPAGNKHRQIQVTVVDGITVVSFVQSKILSEPDVQTLGEELFGLVDRDGCKSLVLDFQNVQFCSSAVIGKLVILDRKVKSKKGKLRLCRMAPGIREVFQIIRLDQVLEIKDTREEALAAFRAR